MADFEIPLLWSSLYLLGDAGTGGLTGVSRLCEAGSPVLPARFFPMPLPFLVSKRPLSQKKGRSRPVATRSEDRARWGV